MEPETLNFHQVSRVSHAAALQATLEAAKSEAASSQVQCLGITWGANKNADL